MGIWRWLKRARDGAETTRPVPSLEPLEPRVLFSADGTGVEPVLPADVQPAYATIVPSDFTSAGDTHAASLDLAGLHLVDSDAANLAGQIVYLDFDGAKDVTYRGPVAVGPFDLPAFSLDGTALAGREQVVIDEILSQLRQVFAGSGVLFTTVSPCDGQAFSTIYIGGDGSAFYGYGRFFGLAEGVDVGNRDRRDNGVVFAAEVLSGVRSDDEYCSAIAAVIAHEVGHLLGCEHTGGQAAGLLDRVAYHQGDATSKGLGSSFVHQYLTKTAYDFFTSQFGPSEIGAYLGPVDDADYGNRYVLEGSCDEDRPNLSAGKPQDSPWGNADAHYWAHDAAFNRIFNDGYRSQDSAVNRAYKYFTGGFGLTGIYDAGWGAYAVQGEGIVYKYEADAKETAYYWLGHVAHLLEDMTLPAHAHADPHGLDDWWNPYDEYETYTASYSDWTSYWAGAEANWKQWAYPAETPDQTSPTGDIRSPSQIPQFSSEITVPLYGLFYETASLADNFDSDDANGQVDLGTRRAGGLTAAECQQIGDTMMIWAVKAVAELFRYFYSMVDSQSPPTVTLDDFSADLGRPSQKGGTFDATASAADSVSGVDQDGYHFITWRWNGSAWADETDWGACAGQASIGALADGLYRIEVRVENGAGDVGSSGYHYFYVDEVSPAGPCGMTVESFTVSGAGATPGRGVMLSGFSGQAQGTGDDSMVKIVAGLRDSQGNWTGSEPIVISSLAPNADWQAWSAGVAMLYAPFVTGAYHVWVQAVPTFSDAEAIGQFKQTQAADGDQSHVKCGTAVYVDAGALCPVYRFWSPISSDHFYTLNEAERDKLIVEYSHAWVYEGVAFYANFDSSQPQVAPVYRFWSDVSLGHFYTMDPVERDKLINEYPGVWTYEGVAFYSYAAGSNPVGSRAVYRFWSPTVSTHFYTTDEDERDKLLNEYSHVWIYEGIAWYTDDV